MKQGIGGKIKFGFWGLVFGAAIATIIGFGWGGWTTAGTTQSISDKAVLESQAGICVAQFVQDVNYDENVKDFKKVDTRDRIKFIEKGGWDIMPGQDQANDGVALKCFDGIQSSLMQ